VLYDKYVIDLVKVESVETALERSIKHMMNWGDTNNASWNHYFLYASLSRASYDIKDGKVSPWLILNSASGKAMLGKFDDAQLGAISNVIDPPFWISKFKRMTADVDFVKEVIRTHNI
jgi:hypothetical protein